MAYFQTICYAFNFNIKVEQISKAAPLFILFDPIVLSEMQT